jgi:hypothetical protein
VLARCVRRLCRLRVCPSTSWSPRERDRDRERDRERERETERERERDREREGGREREVCTCAGEVRAQAVQVARVPVHQLVTPAPAGQLVLGVLGVEPLVGDVAVLEGRVVRLGAAAMQRLVLLDSEQHQSCGAGVLAVSACDVVSLTLWRVVSSSWALLV